MPGVLKEFKDFITRGNVIDLAVAVVIGVAFTSIVNAIVEGLLTPLIGMVIGKDFSDMTFTVNDSVFRYGQVINAVLQFLAVAAAVFFLIVKPINMLNERRRRGEEPEPASPPTDEAILLAEIRDLLRDGAGPGTVRSQAGPSGPSEI
ncbi:MAG TPA: large conductance mechanosensitive channel protein MscL, partial [Acidimicrobiales bacterium]